MLSVPATVRKSSLAAAAQDILSGCQAPDPTMTSGSITMFGFQTSAEPNAPQGGEFTFTIGATGLGISNQKRAADSPDETLQPSRVHAKDLLPYPGRGITLPRDGTVYFVEDTGYTLVVSDSERPGWQILQQDADNVIWELTDNMGAQLGTDFVAYGSVDTTDGRNLQIANGFYARDGNDIASIRPEHREALAEALHEFRNQQGNPGWFAVQVVTGGTMVLADMFFYLAQAAGPPLL